MNEQRARRMRIRNDKCVVQRRCTLLHVAPAKSPQSCLASIHRFLLFFVSSLSFLSPRESTSSSLFVSGSRSRADAPRYRRRDFAYNPVKIGERGWFSLMISHTRFLNPLNFLHFRDQSSREITRVILYVYTR